MRYDGIIFMIVIRIISFLPIQETTIINNDNSSNYNTIEKNKDINCNRVQSKNSTSRFFVFKRFLE